MSAADTQADTQSLTLVYGRNEEDLTHVCGCEEDVQEISTIARGGHALDNAGLKSQNTHLGDDGFPQETCHCKHL